MDKAFDLKPCDFLDPADLRKAQLSGGNYTTGPLFLQKSCPILPCNGHLSASMEFHPGKMFSEICNHSHVLDNHPIQSGPVIGQYIFIQSGKFRFFYQCVIAIPDSACSAVFWGAEVATEDVAPSPVACPIPLENIRRNVIL